MKKLLIIGGLLLFFGFISSAAPPIGIAAIAPPPPEGGGLSFPNIDDPLGGEFSDIGSIINAVMPYVFGALGFIFLFVLILGGFDLLTSAGNPEKIQAGKAKIVNGLIGFLVVLGAYWIIQALQVVFGIKILG